jgi:hypothetical protein
MNPRLLIVMIRPLRLLVFSAGIVGKRHRQRKKIAVMALIRARYAAAITTPYLAY